MIEAKVIIDESAKEIIKGSIYSGTSYIKNLEEIPLDASEYIQVSNASAIISENIKEDVNILGVTGTYGGGGEACQY